MKTGKTFVPEPITFEEIQLVDEEPIRNQTDPIHQMLMDVPLNSEEIVEEVEEVEEAEEAEEVEYEEEPEEEPEDDSEDDSEAEEEVEYERPAVWKECFNIWPQLKDIMVILKFCQYFLLLKWLLGRFWTKF